MPTAFQPRVRRSRFTPRRSRRTEFIQGIVLCHWSDELSRRLQGGWAAGEAGVVRSLGVLTPPSYFGEIGLLEHRPRTATVTAVTPCSIYRIKGTDFVEAMTVANLSPTALGRAQSRLARTHPSASLTFGKTESD